ncbi:hotdog fold thioesterase [Hydrocarboniclastica marina]|uniref:Hotdog fold thioesterase n=1 Tax=Hydrocarboniclastica marina TaxID=2259620 RepID=A0A4P7XHQ2_9ALTE|nr:hotdog fold thioesterase [Hydrocarboniclastica marina]MAL98471.1 esterase [Alteromonadaceae bacterium]QCF25772.1 hotdog fold thioesterase [Hydrocarboniclastica marina]
MTIWHSKPTIEQLTASSQQTLVSHLGIELLELGDDFLSGRMPVDKRTIQPAGILHGGASVVLAETLGSIAANLCLKKPDTMAVGLDINANHVRPMMQGWVYGFARPLHIGGSTQLWEIRIVDEDDRLVCISRLTMAVVPRRN